MGTPGSTCSRAPSEDVDLEQAKNPNDLFSPQSTQRATRGQDTGLAGPPGLQNPFASGTSTVTFQGSLGLWDNTPNFPVSPVLPMRGLPSDFLSPL